MKQPLKSNARTGIRAKGNHYVTSGTGRVAQTVGRFDWETAILADTSLSQGATSLALVLAHYMDVKAGKWCYPSKRLLVANCRYKKPRALEAPRAELTRRGYLEAVYNPKKNLTFYRALRPLDHTLNLVGSSDEKGQTIRPDSYETLRSDSEQEQPVSNNQKPKTLESLEVSGCFPLSLYFLSLRLGLHLYLLRSYERSDQLLLGDSDIHLKNILAFKERLNNGPRPRMAPETEIVEPDWDAYEVPA